MKKLALLIAFIGMLFASIAHGAGTCTTAYSHQTLGGTSLVYSVTLSCVADASDGSFPETEIINPKPSNIQGASLTGVYIDEGTTTTDGTINVAVKLYGTDINLLGPNGTDVSMAAGYATIPPVSTVASAIYLADFVGNLTFQITGGGVNSANPYVVLTFRQ